jgi:hypothetical protein
MGKNTLTPTELKNKILEQKKELNKKLRLIEKKELEKKFKPLFEIFLNNEKYLSDDDIQKMIEYYKKKFEEKAELEKQKKEEEKKQKQEEKERKAKEKLEKEKNKV